jgi:hypothetical protein
MEVLNTHSVAISEKLVFSVFSGLKKSPGTFLFAESTYLSLKEGCLFVLFVMLRSQTMFLLVALLVSMESFC